MYSFWCDGFGCNNLMVSSFHETDFAINHLSIASSVDPVYSVPQTGVPCPWDSSKLGPGSKPASCQWWMSLYLGVPVNTELANPSPSKRRVGAVTHKEGLLWLQQLHFSASKGTQIAVTPLHLLSSSCCNQLLPCSSECQCLSYLDPKRAGTSSV